MMLGKADDAGPSAVLHVPGSEKAGAHRQERRLALFGKADDAGPSTVLASVHRVAPLEVTASSEPCDGHEGALGVMLCGVADGLRVTAELSACRDWQGQSEVSATSDHIRASNTVVACQEQEGKCCQAHLCTRQE